MRISDSLVYGESDALDEVGQIPELAGHHLLHFRPEPVEVLIVVVGRLFTVHLGRLGNGVPAVGAGKAKLCLHKQPRIRPDAPYNLRRLFPMLIVPVSGRVKWMGLPTALLVLVANLILN